MEAARRGDGTRPRAQPLSLAVWALLLLAALPHTAAERHLSVSASHVCYVRDSTGGIECTSPAARDVLLPTPLAERPLLAGPFHGVAVGMNFTCGLMTNGSVACWGQTLPPDMPPSGALLADGAVFLDLVAGARHVCALRHNGSVSCFGDNSTAACAAPAGVLFLGIAAGDGYSCGVTRAGELSCWGPPSHPVVAGPLPSVPLESSSTAIAAPAASGQHSSSGGGGQFVHVSAGLSHACAARRNGSVVCWGLGGDVSAGAGQDAAVPPVPEPPGGYVYLTAGPNVTCGIAAGRLTISCWGLGTDGAAGAPAMSSAASLFGGSPVEVACSTLCCLTLTDRREVIALSTGCAISTGQWTPRESSREWLSVASSADGSKLIAAASGDQLYTSSDSGVTWTARESNRNWYSVASSADGSKLIAAASGDQLYTCSDSGVTWTAWESSRAWSSVASSADGSKLIAAVYGGQLYTSSNSGVTWTARESSRKWDSVASSADGSKLIAAAYNGQLYTSSDSGVTWTARESSRKWWSVASSADGSKLVAAASGDQLYTSFGMPAVLPAFVSSFCSVSRSNYSSTDQLATWRMPAFSVSLSASLPAGAAGPLAGVDCSPGIIPASLSVGITSSAGEPADLTSTHFLGLGTGTVRMDLAGYKAAGVSGGTFGNAILSALTWLRLPGRIDTWDWRALTGLEHTLSTLDVQSTGIRSIVPNSNGSAFTALHSVNLAGNLITRVESNSFRLLPALETVNLSNNALSFIADDAFTGTRHPFLASISVADNPIRTMPCAPGYGTLVVTLPTSASFPGCKVCSSGYYCTGDGSATPCEEGSFSNRFGAVSSSSCQRCPVGTFNALVGQTRLGCLPCPVGTASAAEGAQSESSCQPCPAGSYAGSQGLARCVPCSVGTYSSAVGADSVQACVPCPRGSYSSTEGGTSSSVCVLCPEGTTTLAAGSTSSAACVSPQCPPGFGQPASGSGGSSCVQCPAGSFAASGSGVCSVCPAGTYSEQPGSSSCTPCGAGLYSSAANATSRSTCQRCPVGTFNALLGRTREGCLACPVGTASASEGAQSESSCVPCPAGSYAGSQGLARCVPCSAGTYSSAVGADSVQACVPCPRGSYSSAEGSNSSSVCVLCPEGTTTLAAGSTSPSSCLATQFVCPAGTSPRVALPISSEDCSEPVCAGGVWVHKASGRCIGCPPGSSGISQGACSPCPNNTTLFCPGLTSSPLLRSAGLSSQLASQASVSPSCGLAAAWAALPACDTPDDTAEASRSSASVAVLLVYIILGSLAVGVLALGAMASFSFRHGRCSLVAWCCEQCARRLALLLQRVDQFGLAHPVADGAYVQKRRSALGGACTVAGVLSVLMLGIGMVVQQVLANETRSSLLGAVDDLSSVQSLPHAVVDVAARCPAAALAAPQIGGLHIVLTATGEGSECSQVEWEVSGIAFGSPRLQSVSCSTGTGGTVFQHVFACDSCLLSSSAALKVKLHWSCQSLQLAALAPHADGSWRRAILEASATEAGLLEEVSWAVSPMLTVLDNTLTGTRVRGYELLPGEVALPSRALESINPWLQAVRVTVDLSPLQLQSTTTLLQRMTIVQLLSALFGLAGIFGAFGIAFQQLELSLQLIPRLRAMLKARKVASATMTATRHAAAAEAVVWAAPTESAVMAAQAQHNPVMDRKVRAAFAAGTTSGR